MAMTVHDLAEKSGVTPDTVRHYVRIGLLQPVRNAQNGYKLFSTQDVARICFVLQAKQLGFSLNDIVQILTNSHAGSSSCPLVREMLQQHIDENQKKLQELTALQKRMENALEQWQVIADSEPDGDSICHLIESVVK